MIIDNDLENISHVSVVDSKEEDFEESKYKNIHSIEKSIGEISLNLSKTKNNNKDTILQIYFRNYIPNNKNFLIDKLEYFDKISEIENQFEKKMRKSVKDFINLEKNPLNIVPKKNNSDLKRSLAKKLEKLNRKTEIAILEIIKENLKKQKSEETEMRDDDNENEKESVKNVNSLLTAANMQYNLAETELLRENEDNDEDDDEDDISSNYDQGINDY